MHFHFVRHPDNPVIPRRANTFFSIYAANPDVILYHGNFYMFFRGQDERGHDQIGVAFTPKSDFDGVAWNFYEGNPVIAAGPEDFDAAHVLDPATVVVQDRLYLYYTAHPIDPNLPSAIGLALSDDAIHFRKFESNPVITGGIGPEVVYLNGKFYLFYQRSDATGAFQIFVCISEDGIHFEPSNERVVFRPSGKIGSFDCFSISTVRIFHEPPCYYMVYGGCDRFADSPIGFGLARSLDLFHWERYPGNPIMWRGVMGTWDEGAVWFGTVARVDDTYYLWYEGAGGGGEISRTQNYGGYGKTTFSQIGLAIAQHPLPDW
jgi:predicted GH43/DUF377 family glycosyl hydrolase